MHTILIADWEPAHRQQIRYHFDSRSGFRVVGEFLSSSGIGSIERRLDAAQFLRVHRSFIVNVECIDTCYRQALFGDGKWAGDRCRQALPEQRQIPNPIPGIVTYKPVLLCLESDD